MKNIERNKPETLCEIFFSFCVMEAFGGNSPTQSCNLCKCNRRVYSFTLWRSTCSWAQAYGGWTVISTVVGWRQVFTQNKLFNYCRKTDLREFRLISEFYCYTTIKLIPIISCQVKQVQLSSWVWLGRHQSKVSSFTIYQEISIADLSYIFNQRVAGCSRWASASCCKDEDQVGRVSAPGHSDAGRSQELEEVRAEEQASPYLLRRLQVELWWRCWHATYGPAEEGRSHSQVHHSAHADHDRPVTLYYHHW